MSVQFMTDVAAGALKELEAWHALLVLQGPCAAQVQHEGHQGRGVCQG
jgi:hypothetical protein